MRIATLILMFAMILGLSVPVATRADSDDLEKANHRVVKATEVFNKIMEVPDKGIPHEIMDQAEVIAVFPDVKKGGFIFGARAGSGVVSIRDPQTRAWQPPIFVKLGGGSFGAQIGGQVIDLVLVGLTKSSAEIFTRNRLKIGGEISATAGPVGRNLAAETDLPTLRSGLLSYSRSKGLFIGAIIQGSVIKQDDDLNEVVYGQEKVETFRTVSEHRVNPRANVLIFPQTLTKYTGNQPGS
jgi:lipid-binding SYLF domain-containing protein